MWPFSKPKAASVNGAKKVPAAVAQKGMPPAAQRKSDTIQMSPRPMNNNIAVKKESLLSDRLITDAKDAPPYKTLTTMNGGKHELSEQFQAQMACLDTGTKNEFIILCTRPFYGTNPHFTLRQNIKRGGGEVIREYLIEPGAIRVLYSGAESSQNEEIFSAENPELTKQVTFMVETAVNKRATDIHICARHDTPEKTGAVIFRIDGSLRVWDKFPYEDLNLLVGYMYTKLAESGSRSESSYNPKEMQACSVIVPLKDQIVRIRYQTVRVNGGFDAVLRLLVLGKEDKTLSLEQLGYAESQCHDLDIASRKSVGAIIIAGVTGSGKSTTLKTLMTMSPRRNKIKAYSIEDPVEYKIYMVSQINVQRSSSDSSDINPYLQSMKVIMRSDPDVIMAGEVRDSHSCEMLQTMVQSGHQVMTTVHASSAIEIPDRLSSKQMGMSRHTMSSKNFISALVYQKLIPKLCPKCKVPAENVVTEDRLEILRNKFKIDTKKVFAAKEDNNTCDHCEGHGIKGMTVAAEIIPSEVNFLRLIREGKDSEAEEYWRKTRKTGFDDADMTGKTAFEHGLYKVAHGLVDPRHLEDSFDPMESYYIVETGI